MTTSFIQTNNPSMNPLPGSQIPGMGFSFPHIQTQNPQNFNNIPTGFQHIPAWPMPQQVVPWVQVTPLTGPNLSTLPNPFAGQALANLEGDASKGYGRRERDREMRRRLREEAPETYADRLAQRREREREARRKEREDKASTREERLARRRVRERQARARETPEARADRLTKRRSAEWQRFINRMTLLPEEEREQALKSMKMDAETARKEIAASPGVAMTSEVRKIIGGENNWPPNLPGLIPGKTKEPQTLFSETLYPPSKKLKTMQAMAASSDDPPESAVEDLAGVLCQMQKNAQLKEESNGDSGQTE